MHINNYSMQEQKIRNVMGVLNQLLLTLITISTAGKTCSIILLLNEDIYTAIIIDLLSLQLRPNSDASLILAVLLLLWEDLLPMLRTVVSIMMQDCITMMVVNASSA